jgi:hypothetical protein
MTFQGFFLVFPGPTLSKLSTSISEILSNHIIYHVLTFVYKKLSIINSTLGSHLCQRDLNYHQNGSGTLDNETITTLSVFYLNF